MAICDNVGKTEAGILTFAGRNTVELAEKYGTPLYLMDEDKIREKMNIPFSPPDISEAEIMEVAEALRSGWITTGPRTKELERRIEVKP